jgi:UDP-N-acetyl-D-glucosamine dehydrogenase
MSQPKLVAKAEALESILKRVEAKDATIAIMGMGYVGFPLAIATHGQGFKVIGYDVDQKKIDSLKANKSYIKGIKADDVAKMNSDGRFSATMNPEDLKKADAILMCVPTPLNKYREPDMSYVVATTETIASVLRAGQLVVLESTTYPATTEELLKPMLEASGLKAGADFYLAYSPEREDPGNGFYSTHTIPKVVGADDDASRAFAMALYSNIVTKAVPVSSAATAEAVKLTENIFRSVNIALVNELKIVFDKMGIDVWEVVNAAATKPFGFMPFFPGPGVGGHCIPIDPFYLTWKSREFGMPTRFIDLAGEINAQMPSYVIKKLRQALDQRTGKGLNGAKILILGIAYKKNVDDMRESPAMFVYEKLLKHGAKVDYHDPFIPEIPPTREHAHLTGVKSVAISEKMIAGYDAVVITTEHKNVDYALIVKHAKLIVDTRNAVEHQNLSGTDNVVKA